MTCSTNIVTANFGGGKREATTAPLYQWDYGQVLCIAGLDALPQTFEVHFATQKNGGVSTTVVGIDGRVDVPNVLLTIGKDIHAWIYLSDTTGDGETEYAITIPVKARPMPEYYDAEATGVFDGVVRQVGEYAEEASAAAERAATSASAAAQSASAAAASEESASESADRAEYAMREAVAAQNEATAQATIATEKASQASGYATAAAQSATSAEQSKTAAIGAATAAGQSAQTAAQSATAATTASANAAASATDASASATAAAASATAASGDASTASTAAQTATAKAGEASAAATAAEAAKEAAQTAQQGAETAATNAGQSASTTTAKAAEAAQSASSAAQSKADAEAAATRAETAAATLTVDTALSDTSTNPVQNKVITGELADVKNAIRQSYNVYGTLRQGWYGANGQHNTNTTRITTDPIPVIRGQRIYVDSAGLEYGVLIWNGTPSSANNIRNESANRVPGTDVITALGDWYIVIFFGKTDDTSLSPSDFTGEIRVYSPQIDQLNTGLDDMREFLANVIPDEVNYGKYINTSVGSVYSLGSSGYFNVVLFSVKPNTHYAAQTKGRRVTTKYLGFLDSANKVVSYVEKTVSTDGETVLYDDFVSPSNAVKVFINVTTNQNGLGENVQYVWLKERILADTVNNGTKIVTDEKMLCVEAAKKTFTATTTDNIADNPLPTFIHVTDMHGDSDRFTNAVKIAEEVGADAIINTGDQVAYNSTDSVAYIEYALIGVEIPFLPLIGNHESYTATEEEMYTRHIQPFVTSSGLAVDSSVTYPTYYYKDFSDHKIRVIGVNQFQYRGHGNMATQRNYTQAQIDFICNALLSAPDGYGVIMLLHTPESATVKTTDYPKFYQDEVLYNNTGGDTHPIYEIVDAFISGTALDKTFNNVDGNTPATYTVNVDFSEKNDSEFICYISGHMHRDAVYYITGVTNKQLMLDEVCTNSWSHRNANGTTGSSYPYYTEMTDLPRVIGTPTENSINMYAIDRGRKTVRIVRIGSDMPYDLEKRDCMTIPYAD